MSSPPSGIGFPLTSTRGRSRCFKMQRTCLNLSRWSRRWRRLRCWTLTKEPRSCSTSKRRRRSKSEHVASCLLSISIITTSSSCLFFVLFVVFTSTLVCKLTSTVQLHLCNGSSSSSGMLPSLGIYSILLFLYSSVIAN